MDWATRRRLTALNRYFYWRHAVAFAATRQGPWPGWHRLLGHLRPMVGEGALRVLDVGCGNGRFAVFCAFHFACPVDYVGLDSSPTMLRLAQKTLAHVPNWMLLKRDLTHRDGPRLPAGPFRLVVLAGVLHHLPGAELRRKVLEEAAAALAAGGVLALTVWRFATEPRLAGKLVPWEQLNRRLRRPLDLSQLEVGDCLLSFGGNPTALRYCHAVTEEELEEWLAFLPPRCDDYLADGANGKLNRYLILRASAGRQS